MTRKLKLNHIVAIGYSIIGVILLTSIFIDFEKINYANVIGLFFTAVVLVGYYVLQLKHDAKDGGPSDFIYTLLPVVAASYYFENVLWGPILLVVVDFLLKMKSKY